MCNQAPVKISSLCTIRKFPKEVKGFWQLPCIEQPLPSCPQKFLACFLDTNVQKKKSKIPKLLANPSTQSCAAAVVPGLDPQPPARHTEVLNAHPLPRLIYPCRSLCEAVKRSCAPVMACYGYPWPEILNCNKFPADHELCIAAVSMDENSSSRRSKRLCLHVFSHM